MRSIMKTGLAAGALLLCTVGTARANTVVEANVPFSFEVNGRTFPAGTYRAERDYASPSIVLIRGEHGNHAATFVTTGRDGGQDPEGSRPAMTFRRDGNQYRLAAIWDSADEGWDVPTR